MKLSFLCVISVRKISVASKRYDLFTTLQGSASATRGAYALVNVVYEQGQVDQQRNPLEVDEEQERENSMRRHLRDNELHRSATCRLVFITHLVQLGAQVERVDVVRLEIGVHDDLDRVRDRYALSPHYARRTPSGKVARPPQGSKTKRANLDTVSVLRAGQHAQQHSPSPCICNQEQRNGSACPTRRTLHVLRLLSLRQARYTSCTLNREQARQRGDLETGLCNILLYAPWLKPHRGIIMYGQAAEAGTC